MVVCRDRVVTDVPILPGEWERNPCPRADAWCRDCEMVPFVVERRTKLGANERMLRITRIVAERTTILVITHGPSQRVIHGKVRLVEATLTEAQVHAVITRAPARRLITNAAQHSERRRGERGISGWKNPPARRFATRS